MMRWFILILVCLSVLSNARGIVAATPDEYAGALTLLKNHLDADLGKLYDKGSCPFEAPFARKILNRPFRIAASDGASFVIDNRELIAEVSRADLLNDADDRIDAYSNIDKKIGCLITELRQINRSANKSGYYQSKIREVVAKPEFESEDVPMPTYFERKMVEFEKWITGILNNLTKNRGPAPNIPVPPRWVFYVLLGIICAILFSFVVWLLLKFVGRGEAVVRDGIVKRAEEALVEARDTDSLMALAEKCARAGDYRSAFRLVYLSMLIALDSGGAIRFDRSKTNWEYIRELRLAGYHDVYSSLTPVTRDFDRVWYGLSPANADDYRRIVEQYKNYSNHN